MVIPKRLLKKWEVLRTPGDSAKMAAKMEGGYAELFNRAFREGRCNEQVFNVMAGFYEDKVALIRQYL